MRGFPPVPGEPLPVYPPGPFEAWNRGLDRAVAPTTGEFPRIVADGEATARITPDEFDTDYSLPAIKDPIPGAATASAGGATITGPAAGTRQNGRPAAPPDLPGEPVRRGGAATQPGTGPSHRTPGRGRAEAAQPAAASPAPATAATPAAKASPATTASTATSITKTKGRRKRRSHWPAIAAAIVIILAVAAVLVYTLPKNSTAGPPPKAHPTSTPTPTASGPTAPPGPWGFIGARKTDATPLTMPEVFPATISDGTTTYTRARQAIGKNCRSSVIGAALQAAVRKAGCSQALRATYLSRTAKVMATIGVFNLKNAAQAGKAAAQAGHSEFVTQLAAKAGPAKAIGQGTGLEEALFKGHYLVLVWAEPTNVNVSPSGKNKSKLDAFMKLLVAHTVNASLSYRMVDGKPPAG